MRRSQYNRQDADVALTFPIISDVLSGKVTLLHRGENGYVTNIVDGSSMGNQNDSDARVYLKWTPSDNLTRH